MAKTVGTSDLLEVLGSDRVANGAPALVTPSLTTIETGFISGIASSNNLTWASTVLGEKINHVLQNGVPLWNSTTTFSIGNVANHTGSLWLCLVGNTNSAPTLFNTNWAMVQSGFDTLTRDAIQGTAPVWASTTTINMGTLNCLDSLRTSLITCSSATLNFATTGLNGLDTGSIASNTWYYIYAILNPTTLATGYLASTSASSPTLPSGFTKFRLLPLAVKTKTGSAVLMRFSVTQWGTLPTVLWDDAFLPALSTGGAVNSSASSDDVLQVLNAGTSTSWATISCSSFVPSFSRSALSRVLLSSSGDRYIQIKKVESPTTNFTGKVYWSNLSVSLVPYEVWLELNGSQQFAYLISSAGGTGNIYIGGYTVTEVVG